MNGQQKLLWLKKDNSEQLDARSAARIKEYNTELTPTTVGRCVWEPLSLSLDARDTMVNWLLPVDFVAVMTVSDKIGIEKPPFSSPRKNKKQVHTTGDPSATTSSSFLSLSLSVSIPSQLGEETPQRELY